jgi:hypothetical protein
VAIVVNLLDDGRSVIDMRTIVRVALRHGFSS